MFQKLSLLSSSPPLAPGNHPTSSHCHHASILLPTRRPCWAGHSPWDNSSCKDKRSCTAGTTGSTAAAAELRPPPETRTVERGTRAISTASRSPHTLRPPNVVNYCEHNWVHLSPKSHSHYPWTQGTLGTRGTSPSSGWISRNKDHMVPWALQGNRPCSPIRGS